MRLILATCFLAHLLFCSAHVLPSHRYVLNCDDAEAHQAAGVAVQYVNARHRQGYKFAFNRVESILQIPSAGGEELYLFELDLLETVCPHVSPTPLEQCPVRQRIDQAVEADCDVKMRKHNNTFEVVSAKCKSELKSAEKMDRLCPNCPLIAPFNDSRVVHAVDVTLQKFNSLNNTNFYNLHETGRAKIQRGHTDVTYVEFVAAATNCTKEDTAAGLLCVVDAGPKGHYATCSGTVVKHATAADEVTVNCAVHDPQPQNEAQAPQPAPAVPVGPGFIPSRFHHNLYFNELGPQSSESNSAEQHLLAAHAHRAVKRSLTGTPVHTNVGRIPLCPGRKIHF